MSPSSDHPLFGRWSLGQVALPAHDLARAIAFYRDTLAMPFLFQTPALAFFDCDGVRLMLALPERPEAAQAGSILYFRVADLRAAYDELRSRGVAFIDEPHLIAAMPDHELWMAFFTDSEGNTLSLMSEVR
ncbi:MAG TPA: VOC family protein [Thermomicrobiales bacterium]|jgi:methylmalonyl-CoA/ethylmalonyl-CoA epimerase